MSIPAPDEISMEDPLCDSSLGSMVTLDYVTLLTKSKPTVMNLTLTVSTSSSSVDHPIASRRRGVLDASTGKLDASARRNSKSDAASSSQGRLKDAYLGRLMVQPPLKIVRNHWSFLNRDHGAIMRKKQQGDLLHPKIQGILKLEA